MIEAKGFWQILARSAELKLVTNFLAIMSGILCTVFIFCGVMFFYKSKKKDKVSLKYQNVLYKLFIVLIAVFEAFLLAWTVISFG